MVGIIGRRPAHGTTSSVETSGKCVLHHLISGSMRSWRMSRLYPLNSAVPAMRKRSSPRRDVTIFALSSSSETRGAAFRLFSSFRLTVMEYPFTG